MKAQFELSKFGTVFSTRPKAEEVGKKISKFASSLKTEDELVIDFSGVEAISYSFSDELISQIVQVPVAAAFKFTNKEIENVLGQVLTRRHVQIRLWGPNG